MTRVHYEEWGTPDQLIRIRGWAMDGLTDTQIARNLGIGRTTFYKWKNEHPEFANALMLSRDVADREVENALYKAAKKGNITAMIFWLKNRKPDEWRDKRDPDLSGDLLAKVDEVTVKIKEAAEAESVIERVEGDNERDNADEETGDLRSRG